MSTSNLDRLHQPASLSMIGGAAQGGSAKPKEDREAQDRSHGLEQGGGNSPAGAGGSAHEDTPREGSVGGNSNDNRSDDERAAGERG